MKLSFPVSTFNAHTYSFAMSEKCLHEICKKHEEPHRMYLTTEENQSQAVRKQFFFLCEVVASKVWCHIRTNDYMQKLTSCDFRLSTWR